MRAHTPVRVASWPAARLICGSSRSWWTVSGPFTPRTITSSVLFLCACFCPRCPTTLKQAADPQRRPGSTSMWKQLPRATVYQRCFMLMKSVSCNFWARHMRVPKIRAPKCVAASVSVSLLLFVYVTFCLSAVMYVLCESTSLLSLSLSQCSRPSGYGSQRWMPQQMSGSLPCWPVLPMASLNPWWHGQGKSLLTTWDTNTCSYSCRKHLSHDKRNSPVDVRHTDCITAVWRSLNACFHLGNRSEQLLRLHLTAAVLHLEFLCLTNFSHVTHTVPRLK